WWGWASGRELARVHQVSAHPTGVASRRMAITVSTASAASGPTADTVMCCPLVAPRPMTLSTLLASALLVPTVSDTEAVNFAAATASAPAGGGWRAPGRVGARAELAGMPRLLGRGGYGLEVPARRGGDGRRDRALNERRVGQLERSRQRGRLGEQGPDREHRAPQIGQD